MTFSQTGLTAKFQFHKVRLKVYDMLNRIAISGFQFHKVRLKVLPISFCILPRMFQFHKVRLKAKAETKVIEFTNVSIP